MRNKQNGGRMRLAVECGERKIPVVGGALLLLDLRSGATGVIQHSLPRTCSAVACINQATLQTYADSNENLHGFKT